MAGTSFSFRVVSMDFRALVMASLFCRGRQISDQRLWLRCCFSVAMFALLMRVSTKNF